MQALFNYENGKRHDKSMPSSMRVKLNVYEGNSAARTDPIRSRLTSHLNFSMKIES